MNQEPKKHLSPWIAWGIVILAAAATGFAVWWYWNDIDTISDINITVTTKKASTDTTKATTDATKDWKTYTNDEYGFSFKYPTTWTTTENSTTSTSLYSQTDVKKDASSVVQPNIIIGYNSLNDFVKNEFGPSKTFTSLLEALQSSSGYLKTENIDSHKLTIGGATGYWVFLKDTVTVFIQNDNSVYFVTFGTNNKDYNSVPQEQKDILSTFQFTT